MSIVLLAVQGYGKSEVKLKLNHLLDGQAFALNTQSKNDLGNAFNLKRMEYYISEISITHDGGKITKAEDVYILVNAATNDEYSLGEMDVTTVEGIQMSIGVDPGVNNADLTQWPASHPLAPKNPSMHWGWAAGYRFVAMEGKAGSGLNQVFEIHALGNENYFTINIPTDSKEDNGVHTVTLNADYAMAIKGVDVSSGLIKHGTDGQAVTVLRNFQNHVFTSLDGKGNVSLKPTPKMLMVNMYPNPSQGDVVFSFSEIGDYHLVLHDLTGKVVIDTRLVNANEFKVSLNTPGAYLARLETPSGLIATERVLIQ